jgi:monoamine oxidase
MLGTATLDRAVAPSAGGDVLIVGAGLAGAAAAARLVAHGLKVTVVEARARVGGRGYARAFAGTDAEVEFGGAWITPWQERIRALCRTHAVALRPRAPITERRWFRDGALHRDGPVAAAERHAHERALARLAADAILLKKGIVHDEKDRPLTAVSFADYLVRIGAPPATRALLSAWWAVSGNADKTRAPASELLASTAYVEGLTEAMADVWADTLEGGVAELVRKMLAAAGCSPVLEVPIVAIAQDGGGVTAVAADGRVFAARAALLATGLNPLRAIRFDPPLSGPKAEAVGLGHLGRAVKVWARVAGVPVGVLATGGGTGIEWMFAERAAADGTAMLVGFGVAAAADQPGGWQPDLPRDIESAVARFFPEARLIDCDWHDWNADPFAQGAWVAAAARRESAYAAATWRPEGCLAFATSDLAAEQAGWFEAAIISGEAAAADLVALLAPQGSR